jgi:hypothetical protein
VSKDKQEIDKMQRKREIIVKYGMTTKLAAECGTTRQSVRNALRGLVDSEMSELIRKRAKEAPYYGVEIKN